MYRGCELNPHSRQMKEGEAAAIKNGSKLCIWVCQATPGGKISVINNQKR